MFESFFPGHCGDSVLAQMFVDLEVEFALRSFFFKKAEILPKKEDV